MIVADADLIAQLILVLDHTEEAQEIYRRDKVPASRLVLAWRLSADIFDESVCDVDMEAVLEIAGECNVSAYDAQYLGLARALAVPLVTLDRKLLRAAPKETMTLRQFLESAIE